MRELNTQELNIVSGGLIGVLGVPSFLLFDAVAVFDACKIVKATFVTSLSVFAVIASAFIPIL